MTRRLYLFDDHVARNWEPFALTRPVGELLYGTMTLRERAERAAGLPASGYVGTPELVGFEEEGAPPIRDRDPLTGDEEILLLSSRYVPSLRVDYEGALLKLPREAPPEGLLLHASDASVVGWLLPAGQPPPPAAELADPGSGPAPVVPSGSSVRLAGGLLENPWQLMAENPDRLARDLAALRTDGPHGEVVRLPELPGVYRLGDHAVTIGTDVVVDPSVVLDSRDGPIHLSDRVHVRSFTDLRGPAFIGPDSTLLGGVFEAITCGSVCKLRGEISASVILGYSNKAHDGYLGHALVGRWVNLGAFTTNSDLKNNYGSIRVMTAEGEHDTGLMKVGVFMGDHVKTGIGTLLNGGTVIGAGANVLGGAIPAKHIPPFGWGSGHDFVPYRLDAFLVTAERAMGRRETPLTDGTRELFSRAWTAVHGSAPRSVSE